MSNRASLRAIFILWLASPLIEMSQAQPHAYVLEAPLSQPAEYLTTLNRDGEILDRVLISGRASGFSMKSDGESLLLLNRQDFRVRVSKIDFDGNFLRSYDATDGQGNLLNFDLLSDNRIVLVSGNGLTLFDESSVDWHIPNGEHNFVGAAAVGDHIFATAQVLAGGEILQYSLDGRQLNSTVAASIWVGDLAYDRVDKILYLAYQTGQVAAYEFAGISLQPLRIFDTGIGSGLFSIEVDYFSGNLFVSTQAGFGEYTPEGDLLNFYPVTSLAAVPADNISAFADLVGDRVLDVVDLDLLSGAIVNGDTSPEFDLNNDRAVDQKDIDAWLIDAGFVNQEQYLVGDIDLDGDVDTSDFNIWNQNKFTQSAKWSSGDLNADGFVDVQDFNLWNKNKFGESEVTVVPEPFGNSMLLLALVFCIRKYRRHIAHDSFPRVVQE